MTQHIKFVEPSMMSQHSPTHSKFRTILRKANHRWHDMKLSTIIWKHILTYVKPSLSQTQPKNFTKTSHKMHLNLKEENKKNFCQERSLDNAAKNVPGIFAVHYISSCKDSLLSCNLEVQTYFQICKLRKSLSKTQFDDIFIEKSKHIQASSLITYNNKNLIVLVDVATYERPGGKFHLNPNFNSSYRDVIASLDLLDINMNQINNIENYSKDEENHFISINSVLSDDKYLYVALNDPGCPWHDIVKTVTNSKLWSRMLKTGYFSIKSKHFPNGFTIPPIALKNTSKYHNNKSQQKESEKLKLIDLKIEKVMSNYGASVSVSIIVLFSLAIWCLMWHFWKSRILEQRVEKPEYEMANAWPAETQSSLKEEKEKQENLKERCTLINAPCEALMPEHWKHFEGPYQKVMTSIEAALKLMKKQQKCDLTLEDV